MASAQERQSAPPTGRIATDPAELLRDEVLEPQFRYEVEHLLPKYVLAEKVLVAEYLRMGLIDSRTARTLGRALGSVDRQTVDRWRRPSMSDIAFAVERCVEEQLTDPVAIWHVDRSRNDLQACAQLLFGRDQVIETAGRLLRFASAVRRRAVETAEIPMPGYTHFQAAQVISPGFFFAALSDQVLHAARRLLATYDGMDACPLGAGAMAGQELPWDRESMARLLGFARVQTVALTAVASRAWVAEVTAELGLLGVTLSRFCTDLMTWAGSEYGFVDLPDELSGISSAMPQKKNFPILERIRGRTAHLTTFHLDVSLGQRNTPYTNLVEVSKEAGSLLLQAFQTCRTVLSLFTAVVDGVSFRAGRMAQVCAREYLGGSSLANRLTLQRGIPWRQAQVVVGSYIVAAMRTGAPPSPGDPALLAKIASERGWRLGEPDGLLDGVFDAEHALRRMRTQGSTSPGAVRAALAVQDDDNTALAGEWARRADAARAAGPALDRELGLWCGHERNETPNGPASGMG